MSKDKSKKGFYCLQFLATIALTALIGQSSYAATTNDRNLITDDSGVRWEYNLETVTNDATGAEKKTLYFSFYDKPADQTTIVVPSLSKMTELVPNAPTDLNTYILVNADSETQDQTYGASDPRRQASVSTTKLDMSNTSKIQIQGVSPIIDPAVETELVFGENMVIGDTWHKRIIMTVCDTLYYNSYSDSYNCSNQSEQTFEGFENLIPGWDDMTPEEQTAYEPMPDLVGYAYFKKNQWSIPASEYDSSKPYATLNGTFNNKTVYEGGAFAGYKLKLTNFEASNFNYVGYEAFKDSTFNEANTTITVEGDSFKGTNIFQNTNVKKAIINTDNYGVGLFENCSSLTEVEFGTNTTHVSDNTFSGTNLGSIDFTGTNIKLIGARAFDGANLSSVNLIGIERINYSAFTYNHIAELYLPKSINYLQSNIFYGNTELKTVTVAYDTLTSGTTLPFYIMLDGSVHGKYDNNAAGNHIENLTILAPYAADETPSATHTTYDDYRFHYDQATQEHITNSIVDHSSGYGFGWCDHTYYKGLYKSDPSKESYHFEDDYAKVDEKKNIIAPLYFTDLTAIKNITIGEGYEYVGSSAFWSREQNSFGDWWLNKTWNPNFNGTNYTRHVDSISLPQSLVGVGNLAFEEFWLDDQDGMTLPSNLEFIGQAAFRRIWNFKTDVDLPNLKYLGDYAFESTMVQNIVLHDKMYYMGEHAFSNCLSIKNITIDYDIFNPDLMTVWMSSERLYEVDSINHENYFREQFGEWYHNMTSVSDAFVQAFDVNIGYYPINYSGKFQKFNKITFTEKSVHEIPMLKKICSGVDWWGNPKCDDKRFSQTADVFFGHLIADEIDISETGWKILPPNAFNNSKIGKISLPKNLEAISAYAFNDIITNNELVLPDTVKYIGEKAFECWGLGYYGYAEPVTITKLPSSLEYIGDEAFWGDFNLTADLNAPNLKYIGIRAFYGTKLRDVLIPNGVKKLREGTFGNIPTLRNITINADFGAIVKADAEDEWETPQLIKDYINDPEAEERYLRTKQFADLYSGDDPCNYNCTDVVGKEFETFYTIFNGVAKVDENDTTNYQSTTGGQFGTLSFGPNNTTTIPGMIGTFSYLNFEKVDMSKAGWESFTDQMAAFYHSNIGELVLPNSLKKVPDSAFMYAEVTAPFALPSSIETLDRASFQWSKINITNALPDSVKTIGSAAFYETDLGDNLTIPAGVTSIGWSAFNAGGEDVHYDTVTIKPNLTRSMDSGQLVHQLLWHVDLDKLVVESTVLPGVEKLQSGQELSAGEQEFWHLPMDEVVFTNIPAITYKAFDGCTNLTKVDASTDGNLRAIQAEAFKGDEKLHIFNFSPSIKNETVTIGQYAFEGTAFETMSDSASDFDLTAAKFDGEEGYAFYGMPKLKNVKIPNTFSNATVPEASFANNPELEEVTVDYRITNIRNDAFAEDNKLARIFIWGNTVVTDTDLAGYEEPSYYGQGGDGDDNTDEGNPELGLTIPASTDIYAYSVSPTEAYAGNPRENLDGDFFPLDEVLYVTTNNPKVKINDDNTDFDKSRVVVYGMRRDGVILQSSEWGEFDGTVFPRSESALTFERMEGVMEEDPEFGTVYDTPVPLNLLNYGNANFDEIDFDFIPDEEDDSVRLINVIYTDGYTRGTPDTDIDPYTEGNNNPFIPDPIEDIIEDLINGPITLDTAIATYITLSVLLIATIILTARKKIITR